MKKQKDNAYVLNETVASLRAQLAIAETGGKLDEPETEQEETPRPPPTSFYYEKMPDPDKFSENPANLPNFFLQLNIKLVANHDRFLNEQSKLMYACNRLTGNAAIQLNPYINSDSVKITNITPFINIVENAFGNSDKVATAERELDALWEKGKKFSDYYSNF